MSSVRLIIYVGTHHDVYSDIKLNFGKKDNRLHTYKVLNCQSVESFLDIANDKLPHCVIIDFCDFAIINDSTLKFLILLKEHEILRSVPFVGIFKSYQQIQDNENILSCGINYTYIKGNDFRQMIDNIFYISFEEETKGRKFALAKVKGLEAHTQAQAQLSRLDIDTITIDSDLKGFDQQLHVEFNLFEEFNVSHFEIQDYLVKGKIYNTFYALNLIIPFADGWETSEDQINEDTYLTWLDCKKDEYCKTRSKVICYSSDLKSIEIIHNISVELKGTIIKYRSVFDEKKKEIFRFRPSLIIFDINEHDDHEKFNKLITELTNFPLECRPIVLVFRHRSTSQALQNLFNYPQIVCSKKSLKEENLSSLLKMLDEKRVPKNILTSNFPLSDLRNSAKISFTIRITSITENEITFKSNEEIPYYTILKMTVPVNFYLLIIPPLTKLSSSTDGYHYMGFIMGLDNNSSNYLRKFVNCAINRPLTKWERLDLEKIPSPTTNQTSHNTDEADKDMLPMEDNNDVVQNQLSKKRNSPVIRSRSKDFLSKL